jgi:hypothetical protein
MSLPSEYPSQLFLGIGEVLLGTGKAFLGISEVFLGSEAILGIGEFLLCISEVPLVLVILDRIHFARRRRWHAIVCW